MTKSTWTRTPTVAELLTYENETPTFGEKNTEAQIRQTWGVSRSAYVQRLFRAIDTDEALRLDPVLTNRIRRIRADRRTARPQPHTQRSPR